MASNFPNAVDSFINPQYQKVNGVDYVKAEHINDLQDAVKNIQLTIIGSGLSPNFASNNYVPLSADFKSAIEILDGEVYQREVDFQTHLDSVMPTDPYQHHANVIQVTPIGNLSSERLQWALEELQQNIDMIMSGGFVEGITLDDRYLKTFGDNTCAGSFTVTGIFNARGNTLLGQNNSHTVTTSGNTTVGGNLLVQGASEFLGDIKLPDVSKLGATSNILYSHLAFYTDKVALHSIKDIEFRLDSNDTIDGVAEEAQFRILNGAGSSIFSILENGQLNVATKVGTTILEATSHVEVGTGTPARIENDLFSTQATNLVVQVDAGNASINNYFAVTQNGDAGSNDTSTNILMKVKDNSFISGNHILRRNVQEKGYFGIKFYSDNAGGRFQGYGVNFKSKMMTVPSSVTLSVKPGQSFNYNNLSIVDVDEYGFFVQCDSLAVGNVQVIGTYETVGN